MEVEEFLKEAAVMKEIKHPNLVQLLGKQAWTLKRGCGQLPVKGSGPDVRALSKHHVLIRDVCWGRGEVRRQVGSLLPPSLGSGGGPVWQALLLAEPAPSSEALSSVLDVSRAPSLGSRATC